MIRTLIVDDEPLARETLRLRLAAEPEFTVVGEAGDGAAALDMIRLKQPDVLLLDVRMPDCTGFDVLNMLAPENRPLVVFVTAYDEYAMRAFDAHAVAYLLKPFDDVRLGQTLAHVRRLLHSAGTGDRLDDLLDEVRATHLPGQRVLAVRSGAKTRLVRTDDVDWIEAAGDYVRIHCGATSHLIARTIGDLGASLGRRFVRVHRSAIVNIDRVAEVQTDDRRDFTLLLKCGTAVRLSRTYRRAFEEAIGQQL
jgi:two-component system, LytTR family, response regulator